MSAYTPKYEFSAFNPFYNPNTMVGMYSYDYNKSDIIITYRDVDIVYSRYIDGYNFIYKGVIISQRHGYEKTYKQVIDNYFNNPKFIIVD